VKKIILGGLIIVIGISVSYLLFNIGNKNKQDQIQTSEEINTSGWSDYHNSEYNIGFSYPSDFIIEEKSDSVEIYTPTSLCKTDEGGPTLHEIVASEYRIQIIQHEGSGYDQIWQEIFGFSSENNYDGMKNIAGREVQYFHQGAEMAFGKTAYLLKLTETEALEINTYIPILIYGCDPPFNKVLGSANHLYDQIFETFEFLD